MSSIVIKSMFISIIKCGTNEKVAILPFITLKSGVSLIFNVLMGYFGN